MGRVLLATTIAALLALCGCTSVGAPPSGLSAAERTDIRHQVSDRGWAATGLADELRPDDPLVVIAPREDWPELFVGCMNDAGFDEYTVTGGGIGVAELVDSDELRLAHFRCSIGYQHDYEESGYLNRRQIEYQYDY